MAITRKHVMAKARGFTISIDKMTEKDRARPPSKEFGDDYNRLLAAAKDILPGIAEFLPPIVETQTVRESGRGFTRSSYRELAAYCEQLFQLLADAD